MIALIDVLDDQPYDITAIFNELLNSYGFGQPLIRVDGLRSEIVIPSGVKGIVISGSVHHIYGEKGKDWKNALCKLVKNHYAQTPILGVCFGHQVLAYALGGRVALNILGREIGTVPIYTTVDAKQDLLFGGFESGSLVSQSHIDHVVELPYESVRLAYNNHSPNQVFRIGKSWGIQFHPELQPKLFRQLLSGRIERLRKEANIGEADELQAVSNSVQECPEAVKVLKRFVSLCFTESQTNEGVRNE